MAERRRGGALAPPWDGEGGLPPRWVQRVPPDQVVNEVPQPQEDFAFGLLNLKPEPVTEDT